METPHRVCKLFSSPVSCHHTPSPVVMAGHRDKRGWRMDYVKNDRMLVLALDDPQPHVTNY